MTIMTADKLTFQTHPLKDTIVQMWDAGESNHTICDWLKVNHPEVIDLTAFHYKSINFF